MTWDDQPLVPTVEDVGVVLRKTRMAVYATVERRQLLGVLHLRRRTFGWSAGDRTVAQRYTCLARATNRPSLLSPKGWDHG
jgi:hypothetical protein